MEFEKMIKESVKKDMQNIRKLALSDEMIDKIAGVVPEENRLSQLALNYTTISYIYNIVKENADILYKYACIKALMEEIVQKDFDKTLEEDLSSIIDEAINEVEKENNIIPVDFTNSKYKN